MELTDQQKESIRNWAAEGCSLSEIQKRLKEEFELSMTFMDLRFLVLDMEVKLKDKESKPEPKLGDDISGETMPSDENTGAIPGGSVSVTVDRVKKPGALASGTVTFSDGVNARWTLDQLGRLALDAGKPDYTPDESDLQAFQMELQAQIQKQGI